MNLNKEYKNKKTPDKSRGNPHEKNKQIIYELQIYLKFPNFNDCFS